MKDKLDGNKCAKATKCLDLMLTYLKACLQSVSRISTSIFFDMRLASDVASSISQLNVHYDELVQIQSDAATANLQAETQRCGLNFLDCTCL